MASSALYIGAKVLDQVQNVGQIAEIVQNQLHHREELRCSRRAYQLDSQSVRLDVFDHVKEEIRSHHDTYMGRIDALLLVLALIWPFALNTIQFSDPFVPQTESECETCIEARHRWLVAVWIGLNGTILILPFWGILMLIRCKLKLDRWLEYSLARLNQARRSMHIAENSQQFRVEKPKKENEEHDDTKDIVCNLVNMVAECQEYLALIWTEECGWLVHASTSLLWVSAAAALLLTALSIWIFLVNKGEAHAEFAPLFAIIISVGMGVPLVYVVRQRSWDLLEPPSGHGEELSLARAVGSQAELHAPEARRKRASQMRASSFMGSPRLPSKSSPANSEASGSEDRAETDVNTQHVFEVPVKGMSIARWFCARRSTASMEPLLRK